jgi:hypothetical protein
VSGGSSPPRKQGADRLDNIGNEEIVTVANVTNAASWTQELRDGRNISVVKKPVRRYGLLARRRMLRVLR